MKSDDILKLAVQFYQIPSLFQYYFPSWGFQALFPRTTNYSEIR